MQGHILTPETTTARYAPPACERVLGASFKTCFRMQWGCLWPWSRLSYDKTRPIYFELSIGTFELTEFAISYLLPLMCIALARYGIELTRSDDISNRTSPPEQAQHLVRYLAVLQALEDAYTGDLAVTHMA